MVAKYERELATEVLPLETFYYAEDYHQKYILQRHKGLIKTFRDVYPEFKAFIDSTSAARLNGFAAGSGSLELFEEEKESYGHDLADLEKAFRF